MEVNELLKMSNAIKLLNKRHNISNVKSFNDCDVDVGYSIQFESGIVMDMFNKSFYNIDCELIRTSIVTEFNIDSFEWDINNKPTKEADKEIKKINKTLSLIFK